MKRVAPFLFAAAAWAGGFQWVDLDPARLALREDGKTAFVYNHGSGRGCCYVHPLASPSGVVLTDDGPADHRHHRGLFWGWPVLETGGRRVDSWLQKGVEHRLDSIDAREAGPSAARLRASHSWVADGVVVMRDAIEIVAHPARGGARELEIALTLSAAEGPVKLAGAPEQNKGYGGLSVRFAPRRATVLRSSSGPVPKDEDHGAHEWAEFEGVFADGAAGLRLTSDRANPGFPNHWCLRHYGFLGANFPGVAAFELQPGKPVTLRSRVRVFDAAVRTGVLILSGRNNHDWRTTSPFLEQLLAKTGRFDVRVTYDPAQLTAADLCGVQVLVSDYNGPRWGAAAEAAVEDFVRSGGGFVATHAAAYAFGDMEILGDKHVRTGVREPPWPTYAEMLGARWSGEAPRTGHGKRHRFQVKWKGASPFREGEGFSISDELYHNLRMLPGCRVVAEAFDAPEMNGTGKDEPIAWTREFGQGRVFYTTLGHDTAALGAEGFGAMFTRAVEWAAGR